MKHSYAFVYLPCQSCTAKIHCEKCADEIKERLLKETVFQRVEIDIANKQMSLETTGLDETDLLDMLEDAGVFTD